MKADSFEKTQLFTSHCLFFSFFLHPGATVSPVSQGRAAGKVWEAADISECLL